MHKVNEENFWWKNIVIYEAYVDKFAGTFREFLAKLDYLEKLGITCLHLLPFFPSPMIDDGYDVSDYKNVRPDLGTLKDAETLFEAAHKRGIRILIDLVLNHTSTSHPWFLEARSSRVNPWRDFYLWSKDDRKFSQASNPFSHLEPRNWIHNPLTNDYYFASFYAAQADLNWDNPRVLEEICDVMDFWINLGVDAFRLDAASHLVKREGTPSKSLPETHAILKKLRSELERKSVEAALLAEVSGPVERVRTYFGNGDECHLVYNFSLAAHAFLALLRKTHEAVEKDMEESKFIPTNCQWVTFLRNHDDLSLAMLSHKEKGELLTTFDPAKIHRFGNDVGLSMRLASIFHEEKTRILEAFRLLFSFPGNPVIYYGDEIGMSDAPIPPMERDTRRCVRGNFDWDRAERELDDPSSLFHSISSLVKNR